MGDRALVVFVSGGKDMLGKAFNEVSPTAYLHWGGERVPAYLEELKALMRGRENDDSYALARFLGIVHSTMPKYNLSLGCWETPAYVRKAVKSLFAGKAAPVKTPVWDYGLAKPKEVSKLLSPAEALSNYSHGDAGVVVVDTRTYEWVAYGGYLEEPGEAQAA